MSVRTRVLVTGTNGQVGRALIVTAPSKIDIHATTRTDLDVSDMQHVSEYLVAFKPHLIINAVAYTAVDKAKNDDAAAFRANADRSF